MTKTKKNKPLLTTAECAALRRHPMVEALIVDSESLTLKLRAFKCSAPDGGPPVYDMLPGTVLTLKGGNDYTVDNCVPADFPDQPHHLHGGRSLCLGNMEYAVYDALSAREYLIAAILLLEFMKSHEDGYRYMNTNYDYWDGKTACRCVHWRDKYCRHPKRTRPGWYISDARCGYRKPN